jgi:hypothetical protein
VRLRGEAEPRVGSVGRVHLASGEDDSAAEEARPWMPENAEGFHARFPVANHDDRGGVTWCGRFSIRIEIQQSGRTLFHVIRLSSKRLHALHPLEKIDRSGKPPHLRVPEEAPVSMRIAPDLRSTSFLLQASVPVRDDPVLALTELTKHLETSEQSRALEFGR